MKRITYNYTLEDSEFGTLYVREIRNAVNLTVKVINGNILLTAPINTPHHLLKKIFDEMRANVRKFIERMNMLKNRLMYNEDFKIHSAFVDLSFLSQKNSEKRESFEFVIRGIKMQPLLHFNIEFKYPENIDFYDDNLQKWIDDYLQDGLCGLSVEYLHDLLNEMSALSGLDYDHFRISKAKRSWGKCQNSIGHNKVERSPQRSPKKVLDLGPRTETEYFTHQITLNFYTALLPIHLTKFVMLHELTHTRNPNHQKAFHHDLDLLCHAILGLSENECKKQMKQFTTSLFSFSALNEQ